MDIKIRKVDPVCVKKIDELAKEKGMSRNKYLIDMLENFCALEQLKAFENRYQTMIRQQGKIIESNSKILSQLRSLMEE